MSLNENQDLAKAVREAGDAPCDKCEVRQKCRDMLTQCVAFDRYVETGHWQQSQVQLYISPLVQ